jgi:hypothetical protein
MSDSAITIIAIFLAAILMMVFPLMTMSDKVDTTTSTEVEQITSEFINQIKTTGKLTQERYSVFLEDLTDTGNTYDVTLEFKILDENPGKKTLQTAKDKIGENYYTSVFTTQIEEILKDQEVYNLHEGDIVSVTVKNTNITFAQKMESLLYSVVGKDAYKITTTESGMVTATGK